MAEKDYQIERHFELWKDHNKQMGRWIFIVLLVAILIPWKVLHPYLMSSIQLTAQVEGLDTAKRNLSGIQNDESLVVKLETQLAEVKKKVADNSWGTPIQKLKKDFRELNRAYGRLIRKNPSEIVEILDSFEPVQMTSQMGQSTALPSDPASQARGQLLNTLAMLDIERSELFTNQSSLTSGSHNLAEFISKEEWETLLDTKIRGIPQQMADRAILNTVNGVYDNAIIPVQTIVEEKVYSRQTDVLRSQIEELKTQLENWKEKNLGQNRWYQTIGSKNSEIFRVTNTLNNWQREFKTNIEAKKADLKTEKATFENKARKANQQIQEIEEKQKSLREQLDSILPAWLNNLIKVEEMFQLYPIALLAIICFLGFKANLLRHHFLVIRQSLIPEKLVVQDPSASSVWTLIYRGPLGTIVTALLYFVITLVFWNLFETGTTLTVSWVANSTEEAWDFIKEDLGLILWLGRTIFLAALIGIATSLFLDWKNQKVFGVEKI